MNRFSNWLLGYFLCQWNFLLQDNGDLRSRRLIEAEIQTGLLVRFHISCIKIQLTIRNNPAEKYLWIKITVKRLVKTLVTGSCHFQQAIILFRSKVIIKEINRI